MEGGQARRFVREFYPDGKLRLETTFREGKKNGPFKSLGADGSLATSGEFRDNKLSGSLLLHYPDGKPFAECQYDGDLLVGGRLLYPDGKILGQFGPVAGNSGKVSSLLLQYADGKPLSSARFDASSQKISWQGWNPDGSLLGQVEATSPGESKFLRLPLGKSSRSPWNRKSDFRFRRSSTFYQNRANPYPRDGVVIGFRGPASPAVQVHLGNPETTVRAPQYANCPASMPP